MNLLKTSLQFSLRIPFENSIVRAPAPASRRKVMDLATHERGPPCSPNISSYANSFSKKKKTRISLLSDPTKMLKFTVDEKLNVPVVNFLPPKFMLNVHKKAFSKTCPRERQR